MTIYFESAERKVRDIPVSEAEREARLQLAACYRIFHHLGWVEMIFNHITLRVPGARRDDPPLFLINPFGLHYSEITASSLLLIDIDGNPVREAKRPVNRAGFVIHSAIHANVPDAHCVMHTHTTTGMAVACQKDGLSPTNFYAAQLHGGVAYHDFEGITVEEGEKPRLVASIAGSGKPKRAVILRNHGLLAWGPSVPEAFMTLWTLQRACDVQIAASSAGALNPIRHDVFAQTVRESGPGEKRTCEDVFAAMQRLVDAKDPAYRD
jgi:ribulose-5-phosphate 4-epimerase/fuculose-1-phosphate aldolase